MNLTNHHPAEQNFGNMLDEVRKLRELLDKYKDTFNEKQSKFLYIYLQK